MNSFWIKQKFDPTIAECLQQSDAVNATQAKLRNKAECLYFHWAEACGLKATLNPEAQFKETLRPPTESEHGWVWPLMVFEGAPPECSAACQRPRAPVCLTKATTSYPCHVKQTGLVKNALYWNFSKETLRRSTCNRHKDNLECFTPHQAWLKSSVITNFLFIMMHENAAWHKAVTANLNIHDV